MREVIIGLAIIVVAGAIGMGVNTLLPTWNYTWGVIVGSGSMCAAFLVNKKVMING